MDFFYLFIFYKAALLIFHFYKCFFTSLKTQYNVRAYEMKAVDRSSDPKICPVFPLTFPSVPARPEERWEKPFREAPE